MATRKAYARRRDGKVVLSFPNRALRDFFLENVDGYENASCDEYYRAERDEYRVDEWGNVLYGNVSACDMSIGEYWDGWYDVYEAAWDAGLL